MTELDKKSPKQEFFLHPDTLAGITEVSERIKALLSEKKRPIVIALDGRSGTGKSTLAEIIATNVGGIYINTDDFWAGGAHEIWDAKSSEEKVEAAIDWKRLRKEVIEPLIEGKQASYHPFDFIKGSGLAEKAIIKGPSPIIILDGAYSSRPELEDTLDLKVLVEVHDNINRKSRLAKREGSEYMDDWHRRWDPAEDYYFSTIRKRDTFDMFIVNH
jgi:uridine kinase